MTRPNAKSTLVTAVVTTLATVLYSIGLFKPMATFEMKFLPLIDRTNSYSLVQTIRELFEDGEMLLGIIFVLFTFVFPVTKFFTLFMGLRMGWRPHNSRLYRWMRASGRWSMLDVFVVGILVVFLRVQALGGGMKMQPEYGIYCFGASVLLAIWAGERIDKTASHRAKASAPDSVAATQELVSP